MRGIEINEFEEKAQKYRTDLNRCIEKIEEIIDKGSENITESDVKEYKLLESEISQMNSASTDEFMHDSTFLGKSICEGSPVIKTLVFSPIRVRNILSCALVAFCASSRMTKALSSVRPRMKANGAISMVLSSQ